MRDLSIITVSLNAGKTLGHCIESVSGQSLSSEHIIIDGGSRDNTIQLLDQYGGNLNKVIIEPDKGIYDAMNKGIMLASGEIIGFLHADDFYPHNGILEKVYTVFQNPDIDACYGDLCYVNPRDITKTHRYWQSGEYHPDRFYWGWMPPHPTFFVRRRVYEKHGLFRTELGTAADYELMLRFLLKHQIKTAYVPETLVHMRSGGISNQNLINRMKANQFDRKAWQVNDLKPYPWTLVAKPLRKVGQWLLRP